MSDASAEPDPADESRAEPEPDKRRDKGKRPFWVEIPLLLATALVLTIIIQTFFARVFVIPSESMEQTLHGCPGCTNDRVLAEKVSYWFGEPGPGEVVVFERPDTWDPIGPVGTRSDNAFVAWLQDMGSMFGLADPDTEDVVKRVIAVGGQTVECCDEQNRVKVDGEPLDETYIYWLPEFDPLQTPFEPITVPEGMMFMMGDNRNNSGDSRSQGGGGLNGMVPVDNAIGRVRAIILPPSRWQGVGEHDPQQRSLSAPAWQTGVPAGIGLAAAWPALWLVRRTRRAAAGLVGGVR